MLKILQESRIGLVRFRQTSIGMSLRLSGLSHQKSFAAAYIKINKNSSKIGNALISRLLTERSRFYQGECVKVLSNNVGNNNIHPIRENRRFSMSTHIQSPINCQHTNNTH